MRIENERTKSKRWQALLVAALVVMVTAGLVSFAFLLFHENESGPKVAETQIKAPEKDLEGFPEIGPEAELNQDGIQSLNSGHPEEARRLFMRVLELAPQHHEKEQECKALASLGLLELANQNWADAERFLRRYLQMIKDQPGKELVYARASIRLADALCGEKKFKEARTVNNEAMAVILKIESQPGISKVNADVLFGFDSSAWFDENSAKNAVSLMKVAALQQSACLYVPSGNFDAAHRTFDQALEILAKVGRAPVKKIKIFDLKCGLYAVKNNWPKEIQMLEAATNEAKTYHLTHIEAQHLVQLSAIYQQQNKIAKAQECKHAAELLLKENASK